MRTVTISWDKTEERFVALGSHRGRTIEINAPHPPDEGRAATGFSATELLLAGAGSCAMWDVVEILRKRRHSIRALDVTVEAEQLPDPPWTYTRVALHFKVACDGINVPVMQRVVRLSCVRYCSVITTIRGVASVEATVELLGADGTTSGRQAVDLPESAAVVTAVDAPIVGVTDPSVDED